MVIGAAVGGNAWTVPPGFAMCLLLGTAVSVYRLFVFYFRCTGSGWWRRWRCSGGDHGVGGANRVREMTTSSKPSAGDATPIPLAASGLADDAKLLELAGRLRLARAAGGGGGGRAGRAPPGPWPC
jgi:hypothetical protein